MKVAWVKAGKLLPLDTGGKLRSFNILRQLAQRHCVTLLTYYDGAADPGYEHAISEHFPHALTLRTGRQTGAIGEASRYARALFSPAPYAVEKFTDRSVRRVVAEWMRTQAFDVVVCDFLSASNNFRAPLDLPTVLFQHNVETELWRRQAQFEANAVRRAVFQHEARKMARYERAALGRFHHVVAVSDHDQRLMSHALGEHDITVVSTGVDIAQFRTVAHVEPQRPIVMYLGSMDWEANIDGVEWFCAAMWPRIRAAVPNAECRIVGRNPDARVTALATDGVVVTGTVPSVVDHLREAAAVIVPLRIGGGTRLKIFEAMGAGRAVISTSVGAEGLDVTHNENILLHDEAVAFADAVVMLLQDSVTRRRLGTAAAQLAERYDWSRVIESFESALGRAIDAARRYRRAP